MTGLERREKDRREIDEMKRMAQELAKYRIESVSKGELIDTIIDNLPLPIWIKNSEGCYEKVNKEWEVHFGASFEKVKGKDDHAVWGEDSQYAFFSRDQEVISTKAVSSSYEKIRDRKTGFFIDWFVIRVPVFKPFSNHKEVTKVLGIALKLSVLRNKGIVE